MLPAYANGPNLEQFSKTKHGGQKKFSWSNDVLSSIESFFQLL